MRILLVKTSSLGDVIHNLPVASDLRRIFPEATIDWCVEEGLSDIPGLHPSVDRVVPVAIRRWRKQLGCRATWQQIGAFRQQLRARKYDVVLDTQGLLKSAVIARMASGKRCGYAAEAAREPMAARFYDETFVIPRNVHAVMRNRWLAAAALDYSADLPLDYGVETPESANGLPTDKDQVVLLTATSRDAKLWFEESWCSLARILVQQGFTPVLPYGSPVERQRAERIAVAVAGTVVPPALSLRQLAALLARSRLAIGVDTGLVHLAAALQVPVIALYVASEPALTGVVGNGFVRNLGRPGAPPSLAEVLTVSEHALR